MTLGRVRLRVRFEGGHWYAVALDDHGTVVDRSPQGTELQAEHYLENFKKYGAWLRS